MDFLDHLREAWEGALTAGRPDRNGDPRDYIYASRRRACVRAMALDLLHPDAEPEPEADRLELMERGKERETAIVARLMRIGPRCAIPFEVVEGQRRFELKDRDDAVLIVGKIDGRLRLPGGEKPVFEVKSGLTFERVNRLEDLDRSPWTRHALDQLLSYLYAEGEPWGFFILERRGVPTFLRVGLADHWDRVERFLRDARTAIDARFGRGELPGHTQDMGECRRCAHLGRHCQPPLSYGDGAVVIDDPRIVDALETREKLSEAAKAHDDADRLVKDALRGIEHGLAGDFLIRGKWCPRTTCKLPKEVRDQYSETDPHGMFKLTIERVGD